MYHKILLDKAKSFYKINCQPQYHHLNYIKQLQKHWNIHQCYNVKVNVQYKNSMLAYQTKKHYPRSQECSSSYFSFSTPLAFSFLVFLSSLEKCPGRRRVEEKDIHSVIQKHRVNASILLLTTSVNCGSNSPTHSTFLLEREAETLRLKWDEECCKRCCSCPFLTPSPPLSSPRPPRTCAEALTRTYSHLQRHAGAHKQG